MITVCHHTASLVMPIGDPRDGIFQSHPHTHDGFSLARVYEMYQHDFFSFFQYHVGSVGMNSAKNLKLNERDLFCNGTLPSSP